MVLGLVCTLYMISGSTMKGVLMIAVYLLLLVAFSFLLPVPRKPLP